MYYSAQPLTRQKSSVLGAIKSLVTALLGRFGGVDATNEKHRQQESVLTSPPLPGAATEIMAGVDEAMEKQKRQSSEENEHRDDDKGCSWSSNNTTVVYHSPSIVSCTALLADSII